MITMNSITNREQRFLSMASNEADKSDIQHRHGCVIVSGGKIIGRGYNHRRTTSRDGFIDNKCTCHAEISAIRDIIRRHGVRCDYRQWDQGKKGKNDIS